MAVFIALLRAVNVGGTGKLAMKELCALCEELGFARPRTYIQSGNVVLFGRAAPPKALADVVAPGREEIRPGRREVYVHYPDGMGRSRLKLPAVGPVTARNMQTVARLVAMALPQP